MRGARRQQDQRAPLSLLLLLTATGADVPLHIQEDFAPICSASSVIRDGYGCGFVVTAFHPLTTNGTQLRDVCPDLTLGQCSAFLLSLLKPTCPPGSYDAGAVIKTREYEGQLNAPSQCVPCSPGSYDHDGNAATMCVPCQSGRYSGDRALLCLRCAAGRRGAPLSGSIPYASDPYPTASVRGSASCIGCPAGTYSPAESATCVRCVGGQHDHDEQPATPCVNCPAGQFSPAPNVCDACTPGKHDHDSSAQTPCTACPSASANSSGTYAPGNGTICHPCAEGMRDSDENSATPCCPVLCRKGCLFEDADGPRPAPLRYPKDCEPFSIYRSAKTGGAVTASPAWLLCWSVAVMLLVASDADAQCYTRHPTPPARLPLWQ